MTLLLLGLGAAAILLPGLRFGWSVGGNPHRLATLDLAALSVGLSSIVAALVLSIAVGGLHVVAGSELATFGGHLAPGGIVVSAASGLALVLLAARLATLVKRARRGRRAAYADQWLGSHHDRGDHELVVLPTSATLAYSVRGPRPQVVISQGLQDEVGSELLAFVVDHERAHLRGRHRVHLLVAVWIDALFGWIPAVARSTLALRLTVERAADEEAAGVDPDHRLRVSSAMRALAVTGLAGCASEAVQYRAGLLITPLVPPRHLELTAAAGLAAIAVLAAAVAGHVGGDLPNLVAALQ